MAPDPKNLQGRSSVDDVQLLPLEEQRFHGEYKTYFKHKRGNFLKSITEFSDLWECFQLLNDIWQREMTDLEVSSDQHQLLPKMLFMAAHARILTAMELGFSCCIGDAYSILRDGIESVTHAHKIAAEPGTATTWTNKEKGPKELAAYDQIFTHRKKENLFPEQHGLRRLHVFYAQFSQMATHSGIVSMGKSFTDLSTSGNLCWGFNYFETDPQRLALFLFTMLQVSSFMEEAFYGCYETRLNLDTGLGDMGSRFKERKEQQLRYLWAKYKLESLAVPPERPAALS
jgi:hypothetical protein